MDVVFRKFPKGDVIALFCGCEDDASPGMVPSYMHIGQHGDASRNLGQNLALATPAEYAPLLRELTGIYGRIVPVSRLYMRPRKLKPGDIRAAGELQGRDYQLVTDSQDIAATLEHVATRRLFGAKRSAITGAIVSVGEGEYKEVWLTDWSRAFDIAAQYWLAEHA